MKNIGSLLLAILFLVLSISAFSVALQWQWQSGIFPGMVAGVIIMLSLAQLAVEIRRIKKGGKDESSGHMVDLAVDDGLKPREVVRRGGTQWIWIGGLLASIPFFGFIVAIPVFVFSYQKLQGKEKLSTALIWATISLLFALGLFDWLLSTRWPDPLWTLPQSYILQGFRSIFGSGF